MYVQPLDGSLSSNSFSPIAGGVGGEDGYLQGTPPWGTGTGDNISRFVPPWSSANADSSGSLDGGYSGSQSMQGVFGSLMGVLEQLMQMLQSMMGYGCATPGCATPNGNSTCNPYGNEQYFQNATGSSEGDPHLAFNGSRWNNMSSQPDLLNSNSFQGGFQISTQVTPPNGKGVTWNQSATVALDNGATTVSLNANGGPSIMRDGQAISIAPGQTLRLGQGESVTYEQNGALRLVAQNGNGGQIATTLSTKNNGVDVDVTAHDVDLGGSLVNGSNQHGPISGPIPGPNPGPIPGPTPGPLPGPIIAPQPPIQILPIEGTNTSTRAPY